MSAISIQLGRPILWLLLRDTVPILCGLIFPPRPPFHLLIIETLLYVLLDRNQTIEFRCCTTMEWFNLFCLIIPIINQFLKSGINFMRLASLHPNPKGMVQKWSRYYNFFNITTWEWYLCIQIPKRWFRNGRDNWKLRAVAPICAQDMISCITAEKVHEELKLNIKITTSGRQQKMVFWSPNCRISEP